jgi:hypothetical protein
MSRTRAGGLSTNSWLAARPIALLSCAHLQQPPRSLQFDGARAAFEYAPVLRSSPAVSPIAAIASPLASVVVERSARENLRLTFFVNDEAKETSACDLARAARRAGCDTVRGDDEITGGAVLSAIGAYFSNLDGAKVTELRARLRAKEVLFCPHFKSQCRRTGEWLGKERCGAVGSTQSLGWCHRGRGVRAAVCPCHRGL